MLKQKKMQMLMWTVPGLMVLAAGCGKGPAGNYNLGVTTTGGQVASNCANNSQVPTSISESGSTLSGSGSSSCFSNLTLNGSENGSQLTGVTVSLTLAPQANSGVQTGYYGGGYNPAYYNPGTYNPSQFANPNTVNGQSIACSYTGNLNFSNNSISGNLQSSTTQYNGQCPTNISLNGSQS